MRLDSSVAAMAMRFLALALLGLPTPALAQQVAPKVGDSFVIVRNFQTETHDNRGSTSTTSDNDTLQERVVAVRDDGVELEYQLGNVADRSSSWQFPARVIRPFRGPLRLANPGEWQGRIDAWLQRSGMTRAACGHWIFTWNAFLIDCDPQSVLESVQAFELNAGDPRDGASYTIPNATGSAALIKKGDRRLGVTLTVDPEAVRRARADQDVVVAELSGKSLSAEAARHAHASEAISGTIDVTFDLDADGHAVRRTTVTKVEVKSPDGTMETRTATEILERRGAPKPPRDPNMI